MSRFSAGVSALATRGRFQRTSSGRAYSFRHGDKDDARYFGLRFQRPYVPFEAAEPDDFLLEISGEIIDGETEAVAGHFRAFYADLELASSCEQGPRDVLGGCHQTGEFVDALLAPDDSVFSEDVQRCLRWDIFGSNVLVIDEVDVLPELHPSAVALLALRCIIERFRGGAAIVAMDASSLPFAHDASRLGFVELRGTSFLLMSTEWRLPSVSELLAAQGTVRMVLPNSCVVQR